MDQHLIPALGGDGLSIYQFKTAICEVAVILRIGVGHDLPGVFKPFRHLGRALGVNLQKVPVRVKGSGVGVGAPGVPSA